MHLLRAGIVALLAYVSLLAVSSNAIADATGTWRVLPKPSFTAWTVEDDAPIVDPVRDRMVVFGGSIPFSGNTSQTGSYDFDNFVWTELFPAGTPPQKRKLHAAVYDAPRDRMVVFGGQDAGALGDVWALTFDPLQWTPILTTGDAPGPRSGHASAVDLLRHRLLVFGGNGSSDPDVYALDLVTAVWTRISAPGGPTARGRAVGAYDPVRDRFIVVGGTGAPAMDAWALTLAGTPAWNQIVATGVPPAFVAPLRGFYEPVLDRVVAYGGEVPDARSAIVFSLFLSGTPSWGATSTSPIHDYRGPQIAHDPARNRLLLHGGGRVTGLGNYTYNFDVHELSWAATLPVPEPLSASRTRVVNVRPNPGRAEHDIEIELAAHAGRATIEVLSADGRRVWAREIGAEGNGTRTVRWNGSDARGRTCPPGVYWAALRTSRGSQTARFVRVR